MNGWRAPLPSELGRPAKMSAHLFGSLFGEIHELSSASLWSPQSPGQRFSTIAEKVVEDAICSSPGDYRVTRLAGPHARSREGD